jgi:hypothetical protein
MKRRASIINVDLGYRVTFFLHKKPVNVLIYRNALQADDAVYTWEMFGEYQFPY